MTNTYYYELSMPHTKIFNVARFANFHLRYLMARKMSCIAVRHGARLTVERLTWKRALRVKFESILGE